MSCFLVLIVLVDRPDCAGGGLAVYTKFCTPSVKGGTTVIAFVTDPDGYKIELIQEKSRTYSTSRQSEANFDPLRA